MQLTEEEQKELEIEIDRIGHIENKEKQQYEFLKFFHDNCLWKKAVNEVFNSYIVEVRPM
jgi:hypothetical protein